jgi:hypothetical protein
MKKNGTRAFKKERFKLDALMLPSRKTTPIATMAVQSSMGQPLTASMKS